MPDPRNKSRTNQLLLSASVQETSNEKQNQILTSHRSYMTNLTTLYRKDVHHQNDATNTKQMANKTGKKPEDGA